MCHTILAIVNKPRTQAILSIILSDMKTNTDLTTGNSPAIINLTDVPTAVAIQTASTSERVRITIENLTPNRGPIAIPVRIVEDIPKMPRYSDVMESLSRIATIDTATPREFLALALICEILES